MITFLVVLYGLSMFYGLFTFFYLYSTELSTTGLKDGYVFYICMLTVLVFTPVWVLIAITLIKEEC